MTIRESVTEILDNSPESVISLWGITDQVSYRTGHRNMPSTVRDACIAYADASGSEFFCVDRMHGKYKFIPSGIKLSGCLTGIE